MAHWNVDNPDHTITTDNDNDYWRGVTPLGNNIKNTADYLIHEILVYDYSDDTAKEKVWTKLRVLDSYPDPYDTNEMTLTASSVIDALPSGDGRRVVPVTTIDNPSETDPDLITRTTVYYLENEAYARDGDHWEELQRELDFLDIYVRDREGTLASNEKSFTEYKAASLRRVQRYTRRGFEDYQIPHRHRYTKLSDAQFNRIYQVLKTGINKNYGFLTDPKKITTDLLLNPIDKDSHNGLLSLNNLLLPVEIEDDSRDSGKEMALPPDNSYVSAMNGASSGIWAEARDLVNNLKDNPGESDSNWAYVNQTSSWYEPILAFPPGSPWDTRSYTYNHKIYYGAHFPRKRVQLNTDATGPGDSTFRGSNYSVDGSGDPDEGYLFHNDWRNINNLTHPTDGDYVPVVAPQSYRLGYNPSWNGTSWLQTSPAGGPWIPRWIWQNQRKASEMGDGTTRERFIDNFELKRIDVYSFTQVKSLSTSGGQYEVENSQITQTEQTITESDLTTQGDDFINAWDTINYIRENMVLNFNYTARYGTGSRYQIESLVGLQSGDIPNLTTMTKGAIVARKYSKQDLQNRILKEKI